MDSLPVRGFRPSLCLLLLLATLLPSCMTVQLWESGRTREQDRIEPHPLERATLRAGASADQLFLVDDEGTGRLVLTGRGYRDTETAHLLLCHPEVLSGAQVTVEGQLVPTDGAHSRAYVVLRGNLSAEAARAAGNPRLVEVVDMLSRHGVRVEHRSSWGLRGISKETFRSEPQGEARANVAVEIRRRGASYTSVPMRCAQVALTPAALVADLVVTPMVFVYYGCFHRGSLFF